MCGIVGILGKENVAEPILEALKRLEYRGYDSAGIATVNKGAIDRRRAKGKLNNLQAVLADNALEGSIGIGHTRWATHGEPTSNNAHPHANEKVAVVHNGIIENYKELKAELEAEGVAFTTQTDTEVIVHLFSSFLETEQNIHQAAKKTFNRLEGAFAIGMLLHGEEDRMIAARKGSPLAIGHGDGEMYIGSDAFSLAPLSSRVTYLEDGDWADITRTSLDVFTADGSKVDREITIVDAATSMVDKGTHRHFMAKEIFEQPEVISNTFGHYIDGARDAITLPEMGFDFNDINRIAIIACGTAFYAGMVAKTWFERMSGIPTDLDIASEFRYRQAPLDSNSLAVFVSQSGETADTLAALNYCKAHNVKTLAIVNVKQSSIDREADVTLQTFAGPEIGVASTKAFSCQLAVLLSVALFAAKQRSRMTPEEEAAVVASLLSVPRMLGDILKRDAEIQAIAENNLSKADNAIFIGRQSMYALALEGALKLKEISYIHAEGFAAGELKHGSIALIDENMPVIALAPSDDISGKTVSNVEEVLARKGHVILIGSEANCATLKTCQAHLSIPETDDLVAPIVYAVPLQLLAYHTAVAKGTDVDQPRNLAKSVTVE
ncbi:MAG: glutamine--fructose-6-phosphate transaminase (isomerizing) [Parvibaculales bacterium]